MPFDLLGRPSTITPTMLSSDVCMTSDLFYVRPGPTTLKGGNSHGLGRYANRARRGDGRRTDRPDRRGFLPRHGAQAQAAPKAAETTTFYYLPAFGNACTHVIQPVFDNVISSGQPECAVEISNRCRTLLNFWSRNGTFCHLHTPIIAPYCKTTALAISTPASTCDTDGQPLMQTVKELQPDGTKDPAHSLEYWTSRATGGEPKPGHDTTPTHGNTRRPRPRTRTPVTRPRHRGVPFTRAGCQSVISTANSILEGTTKQESPKKTIRLRPNSPAAPSSRPTQARSRITRSPSTAARVCNAPKATPPAADAQRSSTAQTTRVADCAA